MDYLRDFWNDEGAQNLVEYAIIVGFLTLSIVGLMIGPGNEVKDVWKVANNQLVKANVTAS